MSPLFLRVPPACITRSWLLPPDVRHSDTLGIFNLIEHSNVKTEPCWAFFCMLLALLARFAPTDCCNLSSPDGMCPRCLLALVAARGASDIMLTGLPSQAVISFSRKDWARPERSERASNRTTQPAQRMKASRRRRPYVLQTRVGM